MTLLTIPSTITRAEAFAQPDLLVQAFRHHGYVHVSGVVAEAELAVLRRETASVLDVAVRSTPSVERPPGMGDGAYHRLVNDWVLQQRDSLPAVAQDTYYFPTARGLVPRAVDFIPHHCRSARALLGHPGILRLVEMMQGPAFILGATPMVVKMPGDGAEMPWHRDGLRPEDLDEEVPTFTAGVYLDDAVAETAVRILPGSHRWTVERVQAECRIRNGQRRYDDEAAVVAVPKAGDLLIHHTWVIHGSPASQGPLRRVIYESFTPLAVAAQLLVDTQLHLGHRRIHLGMMERQYQDYAAEEMPYAYRCNLSAHDGTLRRWQDLDPFRLHHGAFRR